MKPIVIVAVAAFVLPACSRTDNRFTAEPISTALAAPASTDRMPDPLTVLPPLSPIAEDREILDFQ
jgi:hypothetical protein